MSQFQSDLQKGKRAERLVKEVFSSFAPRYDFIDVSDDSSYYDIGDILAICKEDGSIISIEVKNDEKIHKSYNILCEEEIFDKRVDEFVKGNMSSTGDIYCVVSEPARRIYVFDFAVLRQIYKKGEFTVLHHATQDTYCYLLPTGIAKRYNALIKDIEY